jgi:hypothetical protein
MQCPDCEDKYKVTVAGKTFCANCGTSDQGFAQVSASPIAKVNQPASQDYRTASVAPVNVAEPVVQAPIQNQQLYPAPQPQMPPAPVQQAPMPVRAPAPPMPQPQMSQAPVQPMPPVQPLPPVPQPQMNQAPVQPLPPQPPMPPMPQAGQAPLQPVPPMPQINQATAQAKPPVATPTMPQPQASQAPVPQITVSSALPSSSDAKPASEISKTIQNPSDQISSAANEANAGANSQGSIAPKITSMHGLKTDAAKKPEPEPEAKVISKPNQDKQKVGSSAPTHKKSNSAETLGSEMSSLDSKDEGIFSDEQLKELSSQDEPTSGATPADTPTATSTDPEQDSIVSGSAMKVIQPLHDDSGATMNPFTKRLVGPDGKPSSPEQIDAIIKNNAGSSLSINGITAPTPAASALPSPNTTTPTAVAPAIPQAQAPQPQAQSMPGPVPADTAGDKPKSTTKKTAGKIASITASMAGVALLGFYVWQINFPNLALKVASSKAGINASLPSYMPSGWKVSGDVTANPGSVSYDLSSQDGSKKVSISESRTDWDSQALAENYLQSKVSSYTALQSQGLTIYMYDNQASWVNQGTWYRIEGENNGLTKDQIIKMATSI